MSSSWIRRLFGQTSKPSRRQHGSPRRYRSSFRPMLEQLEDRMLLSAPETMGAILPQAAPLAGNSGVSPTYLVDGSGNLFTVNDTTGQTQLVGSTGLALSDIALSPSGQMYGMNSTGQLYQINDTTGATTLVGQLIDQSTGQPPPSDTYIMAFRGDGTLFVATTDNLYQVNPQTAVGQQVLTNSDVLTSEGMVFDANGDLLLTEGDGSLVEVNPSLTSVQTIGNTGVDDLYGLAWSGGTLYGFSNSQEPIYQINPATAATTSQASLTPFDDGGPDAVNGATSLPLTTTAGLTLSPSTIASGTVGTAYSQTISAGGGSGTLSVSTTLTSSELPSGLHDSINGGSLTISGTPTATGSASFSVTASDSNGDTPVTQNYTLTVNSNSVGSSTYFIDEEGNLFTVNDTNGQTKFIGQTSTIMYDIALSPSGQMYGLGEDGNLYQINDATAATTLVGHIGLANGQPILSGANGMEFRGDGTLFVSSQDVVYQVNPQTAVAQQVLTLPNNEQSAGDLVFNASGDMFLTTADGSLIEANPTLTSANIVGNTGVNDLFGLVISGGTMYGFGDSEDAVYQVNPVTAAVTLQAHFTPTDGHQPVGVNGATTTPVSSTAVLTLSPSTIANGTVGTLYSQTISAGGGSGTLHVSDTITSGVIPAGLSFSTNGGTLTISGTPTAAGSVSFSVTASDSNNDTPVTQSYTLTVNSNIVGSPTYIVDEQGNLFTVNDTNGQTHLVGQTGVTLSDIALSPSGQMYGMNSTGQLYQINDTTGATTLVGQLIDQSTGQPPPSDTYIMAFRGDGTLFVATTSNLYQVNPQTAVGQQVLTNSDVLTSEGMVFDANGDLLLTEGDGSLVEVNPSLTSVQTIGNTGVDDLYGLAWSGGTLYGFGNSEDAIYQINPATGATTLQANLPPTGAGGPDFVEGATSLPLTTTATPLSLSPSTIASGTVGTAYSQTISAGGGSGTLTVNTNLTSSELPAGLSLTNSNGKLTISGTPTAAGSVSFSVTASDSNGDTPVTQNYTLTVNAAGVPPVIVTPASTIFTAGLGGVFTVGAVGDPTPGFVVSGALPPGVNFTVNGNGTAALWGTPAVGTQGTYHFTITAVNGVGPGYTQDFTLVVNPAPVPPRPPQPNPPSVPSLLGFLNGFLGAAETMSSTGTTITASIFGFPLLLEIYDFSGHLVSASLFGFDITALVELF